MMKHGTCPKCGSSDVYEASCGIGQRNFRQLSFFARARLVEYVCCGCGLVESYLADMSDIDKIKEACTKVETES